MDASKGILNTVVQIQSLIQQIIKVGKDLQDHQVKPSSQHHHAC